MKITLLTGYAEEPIIPKKDTHTYILLCSSSINKWNTPIEKRVAVKYPEVYDTYKAAVDKKQFPIGDLMYIKVAPRITVVLMSVRYYSNKNAKSDGNGKVRFPILGKCLYELSDYIVTAPDSEASVHCSHLLGLKVEPSNVVFLMSRITMAFKVPDIDFYMYDTPT